VKRCEKESPAPSRFLETWSCPNLRPGPRVGGSKLTALFAGPLAHFPFFINLRSGVYSSGFGEHSACLPQLTLTGRSLPLHNTYSPNHTPAEWVRDNSPTMRRQHLKTKKAFEI